MAPPTLKLDMEQHLATVHECDQEDLVHGHRTRGQFARERTDSLYRCPQEPSGKVQDKGAHQPFEQTISFRHSSPSVCCGTRQRGQGVNGQSIIRTANQVCQKPALGRRRTRWLWTLVSVIRWRRLWHVTLSP